MSGDTNRLEAFPEGLPGTSINNSESTVNFMVEIVHKPASSFYLRGWGFDEYHFSSPNGSFIGYFD